MKIELKRDSNYIRHKRRYVFRKFTQAVAMILFIIFFVFVSHGIEANVNFIGALLSVYGAGFFLWIGGTLR